MHQQRQLHSINATEKALTRSDYLPALVLSLCSLGLIFWMLIDIPPNSVKNVFFPNGYLPFLFLMMSCAISGLTFALMHLRRGVMWGTFGSLLLWFQFQHILNFALFGYLFLPILVLELILTFLKDR